ncbi:MAG TPA: phosphotransferase [Pedococcus sp.]
MDPVDTPPEPQVDYHRTAVRPAFDVLPPEVRRQVERLAGAPVARAEPPAGSGFTRGYAGRLALADGRRVFAKAAGHGAPHARDGIEVEARVLRLLDGRATAPVALGAGPVEVAGEDDDPVWWVLVLEDIEGHLPGQPWTPADADAVHEACLRVSEVEPDDVARLTTTTLADDVGRDPAIHATLSGLVDDPATTAPWLAPLSPSAGPDLVALAALGGQALAGDRLVHCDLRPDNLLVEARTGRARIVDWNWATRGPAWVDLVGLWPLMWACGVDPGRFAGSPLLAGSDPDHHDAFLALLAGYYVQAAGGDDRGGELRVLRAHQRAGARQVLAFLAARRGWS